MKKKLLALLLVAVMVISLMPVSAFAATRHTVCGYGQKEPCVCGEWHFGEHPDEDKNLICDVCEGCLNQDRTYDFNATHHWEVCNMHEGHNQLNYREHVSDDCYCGYTKPADPHAGHQINDVPGKAATCTEKGLTDGKFCVTCGKFVVSQKDIPAHDVVVVKGKEATCTEKGLTEGLFCNTCGKFVKNQKDIPAGHKEVDVPGKEATCTEKGLTDGKWCEVCHMFTVNQKDIPAHNVVDVPAKEATCTEKGLTDGEFCMDCLKFVRNQKDVPALGHKWVATSTKSTCTEHGYTTTKCEVCGANGLAAQHKLDDHKYEDGKCTVCGAEDPDYVAPTTKPEETTKPTEPEATTKPTEPEATTKPTEPEATTKPTEAPTTKPTEKPTEAPTTKPADPDQDKVPQTGDNTGMILATMTGIALLSALAFVFGKKRSVR